MIIAMLRILACMAFSFVGALLTEWARLSHGRNFVRHGNDGTARKVVTDGQKKISCRAIRGIGHLDQPERSVTGN
jgi:hypothetical protein